MTHEAAIADIDRTIAHWVGLGVRAADIGMELKCRHNWAGVRRKMIVLSMPAREMPSEATVIALIGSRMRRRLSQSDVAVRIGVSRDTLWRYETGRRTPPVELLAAWRAAVGLRPKPMRLAA